MFLLPQETGTFRTWKTIAARWANENKVDYLQLSWCTLLREIFGISTTNVDDWLVCID